MVLPGLARDMQTARRPGARSRRQLQARATTGLPQSVKGSAAWQCPPGPARPRPSLHTSGPAAPANDAGEMNDTHILPLLAWLLGARGREGCLLNHRVFMEIGLCPLVDCAFLVLWKKKRVHSGLLTLLGKFHCLKILQALARFWGVAHCDFH